MRTTHTARAVAVLAILASLAGLTACGDDDATSDTAPTTTAPTTTAATTSAPTTTMPSTAPVPTGLVGSWRLVGHSTIAGEQPVPAQVTSTITFAADGTVQVRPGCNSGAGRLVVEGDDQVSIADLALTEMACTDPDVMAVETAVTTVLSSTVTWSVGGDDLRLTPTTISDTGLHYTRAG